MKTIIIKSKGHTEPFDERKLYASVYSSALNCHYLDHDSEAIADKLTDKIKKIIKGKNALTSKELKHMVVENLEDKHVALMYQHHLDLC